MQLEDLNRSIGDDCGEYSTGCVLNDISCNRHIQEGNTERHASHANKCIHLFRFIFLLVVVKEVKSRNERERSLERDAYGINHALNLDKLKKERDLRISAEEERDKTVALADVYKKDTMVLKGMIEALKLKEEDLERSLQDMKEKNGELEVKIKCMSSMHILWV